MSHKTRTSEEFFDFLMAENERLVKIRDDRLLVMTFHLAAEYWLNEFLKEEKFSSRELDDWSFAKKVVQVRDNKIIADEPVIANLWHMNELRNAYVHTLDWKDVSRSKDLSKEVSGMKYIRTKHIVSLNFEAEDGSKIPESEVTEVNVLTGFHLCSMSTVVKLSELFDALMFKKRAHLR